MTEVYNILNQPTPEAGFGMLKGILIFWGVIFLILLFSLVRKVTRQKASLGRIVINVLSMAFIVVICVLLCISVRVEKETYNEYIEAWESGTYSVESGEPSRLEIYPSENEDGNKAYEVSFWINGKYFDSYHAYREGNFSKDDLRLIESSKFYEIKYIVDDAGDNIMLSMSVGEKADQNS